MRLGLDETRINITCIKPDDGWLCHGICTVMQGRREDISPWIKDMAAAVTTVQQRAVLKVL